MEHIKTLSSSSHPDAQDTYFDFQAQIGLTKHIGGIKATSELLNLCQIDTNSIVLDVGCGVGQTTRYIARVFRARAIGVDLRPAMIEQAKEMAQKQGLSHFTSFFVGDAQALPADFDNEMFDAVICESVLAFVPDRQKALREFMRVTKPGGYVAYTEAIWLNPPSDAEQEAMAKYTGPSSNLMLASEWESLMHTANLQNIVSKAYPLSLTGDARNEIMHIGLKHLLLAWLKTAKLMITTSKYRQFIGDAARMPKSIMKNMGYGVFVGQKPLK